MIYLPLIYLIGLIIVPIFLGFISGKTVTFDRHTWLIVTFWPLLLIIGTLYMMTKNLYELGTDLRRKIGP